MGGNVSIEATSVKLDKKLSLRAFCLLKQAERSIHRILPVDSAQWMELRSYYSGRRTKQLDEISRELFTLSGSSPEDGIDEIRRRIEKRLDTWRYILTKTWSNLLRQRRYRIFGTDEVYMMAFSVKQLNDLLTGETMPSTDVLAKLRLDISLCALLIELRYSGMPEIERAKNIEHLHMSPFRSHLAIEQIILGGS